MDDQNKDQGQGQGANGDGNEDAGTLRTRFEGQIAEKDNTIGLLEKQLAFATAFPGVDPKSKPVTAMLSQYQGELTTEALVKEAGEWNIQPAQSQNQGQQQGDGGNAGDGGAQQGTTDAERQAHQAAGRIGQDGQQQNGGGANGADPRQVGLDKFHEELKSGKTREEAAGAWIDEVFAGARKGDERVIVPVGRDERLQNG